MFRKKAPANRLKTAAAPRPAERTVTRSRPSLRSWRDQHLYSLFSSLGRLLARPWATTLTALVMGLALALPLLFLILLDNARGLSGGWQDAREITVFMKPGTAEDRVQALVGRVTARSDVTAVKRKTPAEGLEEFRAMSGFADALDVLQVNPLPDVVIVTPQERRDGAEPDVLAALRADADVDLVQYDAAWRRRLGAILGLGQRAGVILAGLLALGTLLVVGNTVRMDIQSRAEEIAVMQLIGASPGFVRRPFLYTGIWYGLFSGVFALLVVLAVQWAMAAPVTHLLESYDHRFVLSGLNPMSGAAVPLISAVLGWLGAMLATARHLAEGHPE
ncbi:permease-like cell division protein FtsX [Tahibacter amnicola]|uniref:Cell division protein FtsX n=1 Tax=Tahibacter amnicola TaxID=2976241 RepID=A0ABY6BH71_9GAMM|nr:permease-like cell division protein FtsX [Tahibacter amnicola]UXI69114.1 permease-like cell division protein FtsX [Tahibacter amnicola]